MPTEIRKIVVDICWISATLIITASLSFGRDFFYFSGAKITILDRILNKSASVFGSCVIQREITQGLANVRFVDTGQFVGQNALKTPNGA